MKRLLVAGLGCLMIASACSDPVTPARDASSPLASAGGLKPKTLFSRYVSLGTSLSMGVQGAGIYDDAQAAAWPAKLAANVGVPYSLPLVQDPGCPPPLLAPLAADVALIGAYGIFGSGGDLVSALGGVCMPLQAGVTLPTNNLAISGAKVHDALYTTPEVAAAQSTRKGELYSRVLPSGQTQVLAMLSENPTFVSVELATNEVLPASAGLVSAMTPYDSWQTDYDAVLAAVKAAGARAVLVGLPTNAADFPSVRTAREFFSQWPYLLGLGIVVSTSCYYSPNYLFIPGYVLSLLSKAPTTATCADVPGTVDYVVTPGDVAAINARMAQINAHIQAQASSNGYAYFDISAVYDLPKIPFDMGGVLFSSQPFGPYMSIDGVHPNSAGQSILAQAAADAISATYHVAIR